MGVDTDREGGWTKFEKKKGGNIGGWDPCANYAIKNETTKQESRSPCFYICDAWRNLAPFVQFKNVKNNHDGVLLLVTLLSF